MISTYEEAKEYLESFISPSIYKRIAKHEAVQDPLERMRCLLRLLDNPQEKFRSIVITGTSGKGSTAYYLSSILTHAGYAVGLTISPHLQKLNERIQRDHIPISDEAFITLLNALLPVIEEMNQASCMPTYYEILLAMAFLYFARERVDIAVVEVGLEGSYDGTNVLSPILTVLTNISLDHKELLGDTVEKIAAEAVSAIKPSNVAVVTGLLQDTVWDIVAERMQAVGVSDLYALGKDYVVKDIYLEGNEILFTFVQKAIRFSAAVHAKGLYQAENAGVAIAAALALRKAGLGIRTEAILKAIRTMDQIPGRYEEISYKQVDIVLDGAHNPAKMKALVRSLHSREEFRRKIFVVAFKKDKDVKDLMGQIAATSDTVICTTFHGTTDMTKSASTNITQLKSQIPNIRQTWYEKHPKQALEKAVLLAQKTSALIVVTGSLYLVGEVRDMLEIV